MLNAFKVLNHIIMRKNQSFTFERFMWSADGKQIRHETATVRIRILPTASPEKIMDRAYTALYKLNPGWGTGLPLTEDGQGWSSARLVYNP